MSITTVPSAITGQTLSAADWNTQVRDNINGIWVLTTAGDMMYATNSSSANRLAIGQAGQILRTNSARTAPEWTYGYEACAAQFASNFSHTSGVLSWTGTDLYDPGGWHNPSSNASRITVPVTGVYKIGVLVRFQMASSGTVDEADITIHKNGSGTSLYGYGKILRENGNDQTLYLETPPLSLAASDYMTTECNFFLKPRTIVAARSAFWVERMRE